MLVIGVFAWPCPPCSQNSMSRRRAWLLSSRLHLTHTFLTCAELVTAIKLHASSQWQAVNTMFGARQAKRLSPYLSTRTAIHCHEHMSSYDWRSLRVWSNLSKLPRSILPVQSIIFRSCTNEWNWWEFQAVHESPWRSQLSSQILPHQ